MHGGPLSNWDTIDFANIEILKILNNETKYSTILHEIGHALGMQHTDDDKSIMTPVGDYINSTDIDTVSNCDAEWGNIGFMENRQKVSVNYELRMEALMIR